MASVFATVPTMAIATRLDAQQPIRGGRIDQHRSRSACPRVFGRFRDPGLNQAFLVDMIASMHASATYRFRRGCREDDFCRQPRR